MNGKYWCGAIYRIAANLATDFVRDGSEAFAFGKRFLRSGYEFDQRPRAKSRHFLDLYPDAEEFTFCFPEIRYTRSNASPLEIFCLASMVRIMRPARIFEFGTYDGGTTIQLAAACPSAEILTLDLDPSSINEAQPATIPSEVKNVRCGGVGHRFRGKPEAGRITQLYGDSVSFDYSEYVGTVDFAFIDACHDYSFVKSDTLNALSMVRRGLIVWHDYHPGWPGVMQVVNELVPGHRITHIAGTTLAVLDRSKD